jgi:hypothetical protein
MSEPCEFPKPKTKRGPDISGPIYGMAFIGALVYYIQHATSFWEGVLGVLKAIIWPAMLIYKALESFKM